MYLSNLEIVGFKSFAQKTNFRFTDGITSIVGPNGCGKTNVVDAIRWVLGEQKTSVLRSEVMENVIFNGTSARKPLGMAEVSLTLQNNKEVLPTEYTEVTLSRRLYRNGESQYFLNNVLCRLRDIVDLFMDTGMGADSYSVIELKMVESILNGKAEERRHLLEEAAGVTKYKFRRKEAGKKLQSVQVDLVRIRDILLEVQKNVNSLYRQAAKTRRYNNLLDELRTVELELILQEIIRIREEDIILISDFENNSIEKDVQQHALDDKESFLLKFNQSLREIESSYDIVQEKENSIKQMIFEKNKEKAVTEEKIKSLLSNNEKNQIAISDSRVSIDNLIQNKLTNQEQLKELKEKQLESESEFTVLKTQRDKIYQEVIVSRNNFEESNEELRKFQSKKDSLTFALEQNEQRIANLNESSAVYLTDIENINSDIRKIEGEYKQVSSYRENYATFVSDAERTLQGEQVRVLELQSSQDNLRNEINELQNKLNLKNASLEFIENLVSTDETSKYLLNPDNWKIDGEKVLLAESIGVDEPYLNAVDAALGEAGKFFIVNSKQDAVNAMSALKENSKGRATFICRDLIKKIPKPETTPKEKGVIGWISEIVRVEEDIRFALRGILGKTLLVKNEETINNLYSKNIADTYVTLTGEVYYSEGMIRGGSVPPAESLTLGKKEKVRLFHSEINELENKLSEIREHFNLVKIELESIDISNLNENVRKAESEKNINEQIISQLEIKKESLLNNISIIQKNIDRANEEIQELHKEGINLNNDVTDINDKILLSKANLEQKKINLSDCEQMLYSSESALKDSELKFVRVEEEIKNLIKNISGIEEQILIFNNKIEKDSNEITQNEILLKELKIKIDLLETEIISFQNASDEAQNEREHLHEQILSLQEQVQLYSDDISHQRKILEKTTEQLHQKELKIGELKSRIKNLYLKTKENYNVDPENKDIIKIEDFSIDEAKLKVGMLKEKLNTLGQVNFMALEEYDEQNERLTFLNKQVKDLEDSEKNLNATISEINQTAELKFYDTLVKVNLHFKELFQTLFGKEGYAELNLSEGDPLESNIEIIAKPPGKKPHSIEMLSGGEKTLTSIALLFSIYLVKPSPFCILDEVDAPLDDTNIDKFINLIRQFSNNTQFLIVTHNKKTMEASDSLYGITMPEEGISKVVSVKLSPELN